MKKIILTLAFALLSMAGLQAQNEITGIWLTEEGKSKVEIYEQDGLYYGKLVWLESPTDKKGNARLDKNNPDKSLRSRPIMGIVMLNDLSYADAEWQGLLYAPKRGKTLKAKLSMPADDELNLTVTYRGFSKTQHWTRADTGAAP